MDNGNYDRRPPPAYEQIRVLEDVNRNLEEQLRNQAALHKRIAELNAQVERLEKALQEIADSGQGDLYSMKVAKAALEGKQEKERCPHLAGDLCVKEGACECYGG